LFGELKTKVGRLELRSDCGTLCLGFVLGCSGLLFECLGLVCCGVLILLGGTICFGRCKCCIHCATLNETAADPNLTKAM